MNKSAKFFDWLILLVLVVLWGSAYALTKTAIINIEPIIVVSIRLWIGAAFLFITCIALKKHIPDYTDWRAWLSMAATGIVGSLIPFFLISLAQLKVSSALASIYLSATPMAAALLAHFFIKDEKLSRTRILGIFLAILGVIILFAPSLLNNTQNSPIWAQFALVFAAFCYGAALIIVRLTSPKIDPIAISFGFVFCSALISSPFALLSGFKVQTLTQDAIIAIFGLGIGPTAIASILYVQMVQRIGPIMVANFSNLVPFVSIILGFLFFSEHIPITASFALLVILSGVYFVQK